MSAPNILKYSVMALCRAALRASQFIVHCCISLHVGESGNLLLCGSFLLNGSNAISHSVLTRLVKIFNRVCSLFQIIYRSGSESNGFGILCLHYLQLSVITSEILFGSVDVPQQSIEPAGVLQCITNCSKLSILDLQHGSLTWSPGTVGYVKSCDTGAASATLRAQALGRLSRFMPWLQSQRGWKEIRSWYTFWYWLIVLATLCSLYFPYSDSLKVREDYGSNSTGSLSWCQALAGTAQLDV